MIFLVFVNLVGWQIHTIGQVNRIVMHVRINENYITFASILKKDFNIFNVKSVIFTFLAMSQIQYMREVLLVLRVKNGYQLLCVVVLGGGPEDELKVISQFL